jgi:O-antigen/teichoic acid export membrane protein
MPGLDSKQDAASERSTPEAARPEAIVPGCLSAASAVTWRFANRRSLKVTSSWLMTLFRDHPVAISTRWMLIGQLTRAIIQGLYIVCLARVLEPRGYGAFAGVLALVSSFTPFASLGSGAILVKNAARNPGNFRGYWSNALLTTLCTGGLLCIMVSFAGRAIFPATVPTTLIAAVAMSDLVFLPLIEISGQAHQSLGRLKRTAQTQLTWSAMKLFAAGIFMWYAPGLNVADWGLLYLGSTIAAASATVGQVILEHGFSRLRFGYAPGEFGEGIAFALGGSGKTICDDIDKTMLSRLASLEATGIYTAAYRVADLASLPIRSLLFAAYPGFFRTGASGVAAVARPAARFTSIGVCYGALAGFVLFAAAPLIPAILGPRFAQAEGALRWIAFLPALRALHSFAGDALAGAGRQTARTGTLLSAALANIGLNFLLIPRYGWRGAAASTLVSESLIVIGLWSLIARASRKSTAHAPETMS